MRYGAAECDSGARPGDGVFPHCLTRMDADAAAMHATWRIATTRGMVGLKSAGTL